MTLIPPNVLLVDDDLHLSQLLSEYLDGEGFAVHTAKDGEQALHHLREGLVVDVMVLDIMMPKISGLEVLKQVRQFSQLPVIMLTGRGDDIDRILGLEMGADDYLAKPCNPRTAAYTPRCQRDTHFPKSFGQPTARPRRLECNP